MDRENLADYQETVRRVAQEMGHAYADKFERERSEDVYHISVKKVSDLFSDANQALPATAARGPTTDGDPGPCCYPDGTTHTVTPSQCRSMGGFPGGCHIHPHLPDLKTCKQFINKVAEVLGNAYADKFARIAAHGQQLDKIYKESIQKIGKLFEDANDGMKTLTCHYAHGPAVKGMTSKQCTASGGTADKK
jgi:hypothetical protein